jgi:hypothetical protein
MGDVNSKDGEFPPSSTATGHSQVCTIEFTRILKFVFQKRQDLVKSSEDAKVERRSFILKQSQKIKTQLNQTPTAVKNFINNLKQEITPSNSNNNSANNSSSSLPSLSGSNGKLTQTQGNMSQTST